jgi:hypothetical protein
VSHRPRPADLVALLSPAVEQALRAPSVHNTQPRRWRITPSGIELHADGDRHLAATDPDRRDLVLSCGAALHHLQVALAALAGAPMPQGVTRSGRTTGIIAGLTDIRQPPSRRRGG